MHGGAPFVIAGFIAAAGHIGYSLRSVKTVSRVEAPAPARRPVSRGRHAPARLAEERQVVAVLTETLDPSAVNPGESL